MVLDNNGSWTSSARWAYLGSLNCAFLKDHFDDLVVFGRAKFVLQLAVASSIEHSLLAVPT